MPESVGTAARPGAELPPPQSGAPAGSVLLVEGHLRDNGGLRVSLEIARSLPRHGLPTSMFVLQRVDDGSALLQPDPGIPVTFGTARPRRLRVAAPVGFLRLLAAARRADVVLSGSEIGFGLLLGWCAARLTRRPFAVLVQSAIAAAIDQWMPRPLRGATRRVLASADLAVCVSPGLLEDARRAGIPAARTTVVHIGVDVGRVRAAARSRRPLALEPPFLLAVGRLTPEKGFDTLIRAYAAGGERLAGAPLLILGEGPERAALTALAERSGVAHAVHLPGFRDDVPAHIAAASLVVLTSRREALPRVILEALALGAPVVATDCPSGPRFLLRDGELGRLVPVDDVAALAGALAAHLADPGVLRATAARGEARAREFEPERCMAALATALVPLVRKPALRSAAPPEGSAARGPCAS